MRGVLGEETFAGSHVLKFIFIAQEKEGSLPGWWCWGRMRRRKSLAFDGKLILP